jgi:hypothetical protein
VRLSIWRSPISGFSVFVVQCICHDVHYLWIPINSPAYSDPISPKAVFGHGGSPLFAGRAITASWAKRDREDPPPKAHRTSRQIAVQQIAISRFCKLRKGKTTGSFTLAIIARIKASRSATKSKKLSASNHLALIDGDIGQFERRRKLRNSRSGSSARSMLWSPMLVFIS